MFTWMIWADCMGIEHDGRKLTPFLIFTTVLLSVFAIPIDILFMPIEIISLIIYKIIEGRNK